MKDITEMALKAGFKEHNGMIYVTTINDDCAKELKALVDLARADEREACAKVCENIDDYDENVDTYYSDIYANAIRARNNT